MSSIHSQQTAHLFLFRELFHPADREPTSVGCCVCFSALERTLQQHHASRARLSARLHSRLVVGVRTMNIDLLGEHMPPLALVDKQVTLASASYVAIISLVDIL